MEIDFTNIKHAHFIGIGGIGVSAIARMLKGENKIVSGQDTSSSPITDELIKEGIKIQISQLIENIPEDVDLIVYTRALEVHAPELVRKLKEKIVPALSYPEVLKQISKAHYTIAISGAHGKTTTTGFCGKLLIDSGLKPTVVVGSILADFKTNFIAGDKKYFVVEADEYRRGFLNLTPTVLAITNIDADHLDYYKDLSDVETAFSEIISRILPGGTLICDVGDVQKRSIVQNMITQMQEEKMIRVIDYTLYIPKVADLKLPGEHNRNNAAVAFAVAEVLAIDDVAAHKSISTFSGTWRRFEYKGLTKNGTMVYDDYAHHPTEVRATLQAAREKFPNKKITVVFQPHLYSRTKTLFEEFSHAFDQNVDNVIIAPIYAAREDNDPTITASMLAEKIMPSKGTVFSFNTIDSIKNHLEGILGSEDVLFTMGAGDIYTLGENLLDL